MLGIIKRNFIHLTPDSFVILYKALVRSHLEYAVSVWNPHYQFLIEKLEKVQKRATKLVLTVKSLNYEERLRKLNLPTLKFRWIRGDMIEVYKIFNRKYDEEVTSWLRSRHYESYYDLRGHQFNIYQSQIKYLVISENLTLLTELPHFGIVCQKLLFVLTLSIHLRIDWINFGKTKKFCIVGKLIFVPGVEVKSVSF